MPRGLRIVILSRSSRIGDQPAWGLGQDSKLVEQVLREVSAGGTVPIESIDHLDPVQFYGSSRAPQVVDLAIHLEVPCRAAWRWALCNVVMVNPEWWPASAWDWALAPPEAGGATLVLFKTAHARSLFPELDDKRARVLSWRAGGDLPAVTAPLNREFLYLIGASTNKMKAAGALCRCWKPTWPRMRVVGTEAVLEVLRKGVPDAEARGITFQLPFPDATTRIVAQAATLYHVVASEAEGFGYPMAEAAALGALPLWTAIPAYKELWGETLGAVGRIEVSAGGPGKYRDLALRIQRETVERAVESLLRLTPEEERGLRGSLRTVAASHLKEFRAGWKSVVTTVEKAVVSNKTPISLPPRPLAVGDLPHVAVITLTRNRPHWFANMARNLLLSDYPPDKLTWIVADDGDGGGSGSSAGGRVDQAIAKFQSVHTRLSVKYLSLAKPMTIGAKRNHACEAAPAEATVFVMMDDDDHYPAGSIAGRVSWLRTTGAGCVYCSTLPMYHCGKYISAINVPPLDLAPEERVSEATLCFTRAFWEARRFPGVAVAEGEAFLEGRSAETVEIPPSGIIVSFLHGGNSTSRRVPTETEPNGCHYGFDDEFFTYLSKMP